MRIEGVIIAAGKSSRMAPHFKPVMDLHGKTLIERSIDSMLPFCAKIVVVTGYQEDHLHKVLSSYDNLELIKNEAYEDGMFSSLKVGLSRVEGDRIFFLPGDCPFADEQVFRKMLETDAEVIVPAYQGNLGHPVLFSKRSILHLLKNNRYMTLKEFIDEKELKIIEVDCPGVAWDVDTPEDYLKALKYFEGKERG